MLLRLDRDWSWAPWASQQGSSDSSLGFGILGVVLNVAKLCGIVLSSQVRVDAYTSSFA